MNPVCVVLCCVGHKLIVVNMSQQSDSTDLLGGYVIFVGDCSSVAAFRTEAFSLLRLSLAPSSKSM